MTKLFKNNWLFSLILLLALFLRIYQVNNLPLYGDELTIGLDSYSILKTGHSSTGQFLPLTFELGAGRPGGYIYGSLPAIAFFGLSSLGIRGLSIISGVLIMIMVYLLGEMLLGKKYALIAAILTAISPWDLSLSRGGFEAHFALFLALLGIYTYLLSANKKWLLILSAISFGLTIHTYPTYKLVLPVFLLFLIWYQGPRKLITNLNSISGILAVVILAVLVTLAGLQTFTQGSENRFEDINIFSKADIRQQIIQKIDLDRSLTKLPPAFSNLIHNKPVEYALLLKERYLENFSPDFLFIKGDQNPRHNMTGMGNFYYIEIITILVGLFYLWSREKRLAIFLSSWLLVAPLGTSLLTETHSLRSAFMLPVFILLSAVGFMSIWSLNKKWKIVGVVLLFGFLIQMVFIFENLYYLLPYKYDHFWSGPAKQAAEIALANQSQYDFIILSDKIDNLEYAYPVYGRIDPRIVISQDKQKIQLLDYPFKQYGNVYLGSIPRSEMDQLANILGMRVLYIGSATEQGIFSNYSVIKGYDKQNALVVKKYPI